MGGALWKDTLREIRHSINRFISILIIIALGVGFFVGIKCASPSMLKTADDYFQTHDLMDFKLQSTVGFVMKIYKPLRIWSILRKLCPRILRMSSYSRKIKMQL